MKIVSVLFILLICSPLLAADDLPVGVYATEPSEETKKSEAEHEAPKRLVNLGLSYSFIDNVYQNRLEDNARSTGNWGLNLSKTFLLGESFDTMSRISFNFFDAERDWIKNKQNITMTDGGTVSLEEQREGLSFIEFSFDQLFHYRVYENSNLWIAPYLGVGVSAGAWSVKEKLTTVNAGITSHYILKSTQSYSAYKALTGVALNWKKVHWWVEGQYRILNEGDNSVTKETVDGENRDFPFPYYGVQTLNNDAILQFGFSVNLR